MARRRARSGTPAAAFREREFELEAGPLARDLERANALA
jgi:hypothetical protein